LPIYKLFQCDIIKYRRIGKKINKDRLDLYNSMDQIKIGERLYKGFLRRLKNNHLDLNMDSRKLSDYEVLRMRKIYEWHQGQLVKAGIVSGY
jgi:hypothetical protein